MVFHPGTLLIEDTLSQNRREVTVDQVPPGLAFVDVADERVAVVHVLLSGAGRQRAATLFGPGERFLTRLTGVLPAL